MSNGCDQALVQVRAITAKLAAGTADPLRDSHAVYWIASEAGAWDDDDCDELAGLGAEFLQLGEALENSQDNPVSRAKYQRLIQEAALAVEQGRPLPRWQAD